MPRYLLPISALALLAGCASAPPKTPLPLAERAHAFVAHRKIGVIVDADAARAGAVVRLDEGVSRPPAPETELVARDLSMAPVAGLEVSNVRQGRVFGVYVRSGETRAGDLVYLPDPIPLSESDPVGAATPGNAGIGMAGAKPVFKTQ